MGVELSGDADCVELQAVIVTIKRIGITIRLILTVHRMFIRDFLSGLLDGPSPSQDRVSKDDGQEKEDWYPCFDSPWQICLSK
jgi:hypothetical protein